MSQINFRIDPNLKEILDEIVKEKGISVAEFAKQATLHELMQFRTDYAFNLLKEGKITRKKTLTLSGLTAKEFLDEWTIRNAEEVVLDEDLDKELKSIDQFDINKYKIKSKK